MNRGKFVIALMVTVGLTMALYAWWARYAGSRRVLNQFGPEVAQLVRSGKIVELLQLSATPPLDREPPGAEMAEPEAETSEGTPAAAADVTTVESILVRSGQQPMAVYVASSQDITAAPGLIHARHHLLHEKGFEWPSREAARTTAAAASDREPTGPSKPTAGAATEVDALPDWSLGLRFRDGPRTATWLFDFPRERAYIVERQVEIGMAPIAPSLKQFLGEARSRTEEGHER